MRRLVAVLDAAVAEGSSLQRADGAMPAGRNGPYRDPEHPLRNTGHWLILYAWAAARPGGRAYEKNARQCLDYLVDSARRPAGWTFLHRHRPGKDQCNGLIGQAWSIEALATARTAFQNQEAAVLARAVFLMHPQTRNGLWRRREVDGSDGGVDPAFNHQAWFAAAGSLLGDELINARVDRFLDCLPARMGRYRDGVIRHPVRVPRRPDAAWRKRRSAALRNKAIGYHGFNLYALALLRQRRPQHTVWAHRTIRAAVAAAQGESLAQKLQSNPYGYPYNPAGFEVPYALGVFDGPDAARDAGWIERQLDATWDGDRSRMALDTPDSVTLTARLYEATRLPAVQPVAAP